MPACTGEYPGIQTPRDLYDALLNVWCEYTCAPRLREEWSVENITLGQCSITAFLVQDIFGGRVYGVLRPGGNYHCYNEVDGHVFDLTSEQFGDEVLSYEDNPEQFREVHFQKTEKKERYEYLCKELCQKQSSELQKKLNTLEKNIEELGSLAVGFSGGVDSSFLLAVAHKVLGEKLIAVTAVDASVPEREVEEAKEFCEEQGIRHILCKVDPLRDENYRSNSPDRCYFCKKRVFAKLIKTAEENGIDYVAEGSNMDDLGDYRPGHKAALELSVKSPLREAGLYKSDIRTISRAMGLSTWDKPAYACLASRLVYGEEITEEKLHMIERAEQFLIDRGFREERVRMHGNIARIEVAPTDIPRLASEEIRKEVCEEFFRIGFTYVTLDLNGYRMGSMNATLQELEK